MCYFWHGALIMRWRSLLFPSIVTEYVISNCDMLDTCSLSTVLANVWAWVCISRRVILHSVYMLIFLCFLFSALFLLLFLTTISVWSAITITYIQSFWKYTAMTMCFLSRVSCLLDLLLNPIQEQVVDDRTLLSHTSRMHINYKL